MENIGKTNVFHGNQLKTLGKLALPVGAYRKTFGKHTFSEGTYGTHKENIVFCGIQWKTLGKHTMSVGTYGKHLENMRFPLEPMENTRNTQVLRRNLLKT